MATIHQTFRNDPSRSHSVRSNAIKVTAVWHLVVVVVLASLNIHVGSVGTELLETRWSADATPVEVEEIEFPTEPSESSDAGGSVLQLSSASLIHQQVTVAPKLVLSSQSQIATTSALENLAQRVPGYRTSGLGLGDGTGDPGSFFGAKPAGKRIVYVVDRSLSMNHAHNSEALTRYRRLKYELVNSIGSMSDDMYFFIIFFGDGPTPMPANSMQRATPEAKQLYLKWMAKMPALGQTEPLGALKQALSLKPDVVYFLTDGSFTNFVDRHLRRIVQNKTIINTYTFGDSTGENLMKWVARTNGGTYTYIP